MSIKEKIRAKENETMVCLNLGSKIMGVGFLFCLSVSDVSTIKADLHNTMKYRKSLVKYLQFLKIITSFF